VIQLTIHCHPQCSVHGHLMLHLLLVMVHHLFMNALRGTMN